MNKPICTGCNGTGTIAVRVQMEDKGRRTCYSDVRICPVCNGSKHATEEEVEKFFAQFGLGE